MFIYDYSRKVFPEMLRKGFMGYKLILGQARDPNSLVSFISAQKGHKNIVFSSKGPQLPFLYSTCQVIHNLLKC